MHKTIGGFPDVPLMEEIAFSRLLKEKGRVACLRSQVVTSSHRWEQEGGLAHYHQNVVD